MKKATLLYLLMAGFFSPSQLICSAASSAGTDASSVSYEAELEAARQQKIKDIYAAVNRWEKAEFPEYASERATDMLTGIALRRLWYAGKGGADIRSALKKANQPILEVDEAIKAKKNERLEADENFEAITDEIHKRSVISPEQLEKKLKQHPNLIKMYSLSPGSHTQGSLLRIAAAWRRDDLVEVLLSCGAPADEYPKHTQDIIDPAKYGTGLPLKTFKKLFEPVKHKDTTYFLSDVLDARRWGNRLNPEVFEYLLDELEIDINKPLANRNFIKTSLLHLVMEQHLFKLAEVLVNRGVTDTLGLDIYSGVTLPTNTSEETEHAKDILRRIHKQHPELINYRHENAPNSLDDALIHAQSTGRFEFAQLLLELGATGTKFPRYIYHGIKGGSMSKDEFIKIVREKEEKTSKLKEQTSKIILQRKQNLEEIIYLIQQVGCPPEYSTLLNEIESQLSHVIQEHEDITGMFLGGSFSGMDKTNRHFDHVKEKYRSAHKYNEHVADLRELRNKFEKEKEELTPLISELTSELLQKFKNLNSFKPADIENREEQQKLRSLKEELLEKAHALNSLLLDIARDTNLVSSLEKIKSILSDTADFVTPFNEFEQQYETLTGKPLAQEITIEEDALQEDSAADSPSTGSSSDTLPASHSHLQKSKSARSSQTSWQTYSLYGLAAATVALISYRVHKWYKKRKQKQKPSVEKVQEKLEAGSRKVAHTY